MACNVAGYQGGVNPLREASSSNRLPAVTNPVTPPRSRQGLKENPIVIESDTSDSESEEGSEYEDKDDGDEESDDSYESDGEHDDLFDIDEENRASTPVTPPMDERIGKDYNLQTPSKKKDGSSSDQCSDDDADEDSRITRSGTKYPNLRRGSNAQFAAIQNESSIGSSAIPIRLSTSRSFGPETEKSRDKGPQTDGMCSPQAGTLVRTQIISSSASSSGAASIVPSDTREKLLKDMTLYTTTPTHSTMRRNKKVDRGSTALAELYGEPSTLVNGSKQQKTSVHPFSEELSGDIRKIFDKPRCKSEMEDGYVYIFKSDRHKGLIKIGFSVHNPDGRLKEIEGKCKVPLVFVWRTGLIPHGQLLEKAAHAELKMDKATSPCKCRKKHREWFTTDQEHVKKVFQKYANWLETKPYVEETVVRYVLANESRQRMEEVSRPIPKDSHD
ncbi:hypothetical protein BU24DRAFT_428330 [Aaosphaeria arxii CBS 175.79]|uniref:Bacteriophage T5 Orf172 DNA-binding domain-containing protein n=1 Tax=Aaosphaeria arxii CBS 175.79 TaxID=1450172 RepID=A0A6A5X9J7_9PLEO|nr:uncharacterized protein BU24DRAFT_428330 [Aaosphaeria arxii CBS 175.79]KAF2009414.1 hypothetical protein BU24DRAFT_428330 [Aaosphaeria arxii CBS 175.79]